MNTEYTAGSWETFECEGFTAVLPELRDDESFHSTANGGDDIAQCYGPDQKANARLIAAAPELLDALIEIEAQYSLLLREALAAQHQFTVDQSPALQQARAAIAKATGGPA